MEYVFEIGNIIKHTNISTVIDYGCGKARAWKEYNLQRLWNLRDVQLYDPGVEQYALKPYTPRDLVICTDVLEHVEPDHIDEVLDHIQSLASRMVLLVIPTGPAAKFLPDGR